VIMTKKRPEVSGRNGLNLLEATIGIEPMNGRFAVGNDRPGGER
jgi:hypothetical protein